MALHRYHGPEGLTAFRGAVERSLVSQTIEPRDLGAFRAQLSEASIGATRLVAASVGALRARRAPNRLVADNLAATGSVFLLLSTRAKGVMHHRHGTEPVVPQRLVVIPDAEPFTVEYPDPARVLFVVLPATAVAERFPGLVGHIRSALLPAPARALSRQLPHLMAAAGAAALAEPGGPAELSAILDSLLHLTLRATIGDTAGDPLLALRLAAERLIDRHLTDPELSIGWLAARLSVSARQLHRAFEPADTTVAAFIRHRRLRACAAVLRDCPQTSVTDLAARYGFASASHLGALFRARYAMTPGQWRSRHGSDDDPARD